MEKRFFVFIVCVLHYSGYAQNIISEKNAAGAFPVVSANKSATILFDAADDSLIHKTVGLLQKDIEAVTGKLPPVTTSLPASKHIILVGNMHKSSFIQQLITQKKLNVGAMKNKWEAYLIQVVKNPFAGIDQALVIAGNDRRGTAFGVFELSNQMGVSPWWWWADVPVKKKKEIYVKANAVLTDAPKVKYRGIFINDEAPALSGWSREKFGGFNHSFYEKVFELMLRLKANYLWPAMWGSAFYDDDPLNKQTADSYGIVIGTSHHEPLMRAHDEWRRYGKGPWNYEKNEENLKQFWKSGMQRATNEKIVTVGMRGDGDEPMTEGTAIALLERIVQDQRKIIEEVTGRPASETPQIWALYKEVQEYYDKGMRVPDDVTLLLADDNWGNIRKLPKPEEKTRAGGYGIYYHFDYVGGPRNYKWLNTNNIARVWEQMNLAWEHKARQIWIVNVGDIKPMEFPISFFLDYAWNPTKWNADNFKSYYTKWASEQFGATHSKEIGEIIRKYSQYSARRKPELLDEKTYSISNYGEAQRVIGEWVSLYQKANEINKKIPVEYKDAYFQLVLHPVKALTTLHHLYYYTALNHKYAAANSLLANVYADKVKEMYERDSLITLEYHRLRNGKWNHMMSQTHIGYTYWQQPQVNKMPDVKYVSGGAGTFVAGSMDTVVSVKQAVVPKTAKGNIFYEEHGGVSMQAAHWTKAINSKNSQWKVIPDIGREGSGITTFPVTASAQLSRNSPHVAYDFYTYSSGKSKVHLYFSPTLNFYNASEGLQFAVSVDDETPQIISLNKEDKNSISGIWNTWVANNIIIKTSEHNIYKAGKHTLRYWMISPGVVLQKLVVDFGGVKESYLGPPETKR